MPDREEFFFIFIDASLYQQNLSNYLIIQQISFLIILIYATKSLRYLYSLAYSGIMPKKVTLTQLTAQLQDKDADLY